MNFPDEIWVGIGGCWYTNKGLEDDQRYIHESRVPVSCGGTMDSYCMIEAYSSRVCERGTKGCVVEHGGGADEKIKK